MTTKFIVYRLLIQRYVQNHCTIVGWQNMMRLRWRGRIDGLCWCHWGPTLGMQVTWFIQYFIGQLT